MADQGPYGGQDGQQPGLQGGGRLGQLAQDLMNAAQAGNAGQVQKLGEKFTSPPSKPVGELAQGLMNAAQAGDARQVQQFRNALLDTLPPLSDRQAAAAPAHETSSAVGTNTTVGPAARGNLPPGGRPSTPPPLNAENERVVQREIARQIARTQGSNSKGPRR
ncbi:hypothetical protein GCM10009863_13250 [Streptomyces axinellae]|uniref:Uncharacterized protein n=1 Tax=Streptomyces axinellae TaxID=552788 RepID=A0ABP6C3X6_9ACTN